MPSQIFRPCSVTVNSVLNVRGRQGQRTLGQQPGHLPMQPGSVSFVPSQAFATEYEKLQREILFQLGSYQQLETE